MLYAYGENMTYRTEMDTIEKTVDFRDSEGNLLLRATLGIRTGDDFPVGMLDSVNKLMWDFPDLVEKRIISVSERSRSMEGSAGIPREAPPPFAFSNLFLF